MSYCNSNDGAAGQRPSPKPALVSRSTGAGGVNAPSPRSGTNKAVAIAEPEISPLILGKYKEVESEGEHPFNLDRYIPHKKFRASVGKRVSARSSVEHLSKKYLSNADLSKSRSNASETSGGTESSPYSTHHRSLLAQISSWIANEKTRRATSKKSRKHKPSHQKSHDPHLDIPHEDKGAAKGNEATADRPPSQASDTASEGSMALERLEEILRGGLYLMKRSPTASRELLRKSPSLKKLGKLTANASDTELPDGELSVPSCDVVLDNSKTLSTVGGMAEVEEERDAEGRPKLQRWTSTKEREAWKTFKFEIVRLAHTLGLKGWRLVPMESSDSIEVKRLSGALTNAVYVVSPPTRLPSRIQQSGDSQSSTPKSTPQKLLLRIYGSHVDHLIDREAELQILRRLGRKHIGPRLLGTFANGRFEEYYNAVALTSDELRVPSTSQQIAKRMRELHDGIQLLESERDGGPFVLKNIDKWKDMCENIVRKLDELVKSGDERAKKGLSFQGFVCGTEWDVFWQAICKYREWLERRYGGWEKVKDKLVFAHNDAQYGNILRLRPSGESPLLLPVNHHKQLVVIDFEYANANLPGLEFANHFTEWCYNYHSQVKPHACVIGRYPTPAEQTNFIRAYLTHRPTFPPAPGTSSHKAANASSSTPSGTSTSGHHRRSNTTTSSSSISSSSAPQTPQLGPYSASASASSASAAAGLTMAGGGASGARTAGNNAISSVSTSLISDFMLDARAPPGRSSAGVGGNPSASGIIGGSGGGISGFPSVGSGSLDGDDSDRSGSAEQPQPPWTEEALRAEIEWLRAESKAWRGLNSAQWVMWGVVQANVARILGEEDQGEKSDKAGDEEGGGDSGGGAIEGQKKMLGEKDVESQEDVEEFDYLGYARERAGFFWGDVLSLGIVGEEQCRLLEGVKVGKLEY